MKINILNNKKWIKNSWGTLLVISIIGVILMATYNLGLYSSQRLETDRAAWKQSIIFFFYFTLWSNLSALIVSFIRTMKLKANQKWLKQAEILMGVNLTVTMLVYWAIIFPTRTSHSDFEMVSTVSVHVITPIFALWAMFVQNIKNTEVPKLHVGKVTLMNLVFPVVWLIIAIIIYYSLGSNEHAAIYKFLNFSEHKWYMSVAYVVGVGVTYAGLTALYTWITNKDK